jgi:acetyl esterase/lipase
VPYDLSEEPADIGGQGSPQEGDTAEADPWCKLAPSPHGPDATYWYKSFGVPPVSLGMDEYHPTITQQAPGPFPVMVVAHGGGWAKGCRYSMAGVANFFAHDPSISTHFTVLSIDYRLACQSSDPAITTFVVALCDWPYSRVDTARNAPGAAIWDIQDAVAYVRDTWANLPGHQALWNGAVVLLGGSAGGNMSLVAATLAQSGSTRPDALVGLSGFPRFTRYLNHSSTVWGCDNNVNLHQSNDPTNCAKGEISYQGPPIHWEGGINRYLPCPNIIVGWDSACDVPGAGLYEAASPYDIVANQQIYPPDTYLVNGGGPNAGVSAAELAALQASIDFDGEIAGQVPAHRLCTVNSTEHATHLLGLSCNDEPPGSTVRVSLDLWLADIVCEPPFEACGG